MNKHQVKEKVTEIAGPVTLLHRTSLAPFLSYRTIIALVISFILLIHAIPATAAGPALVQSANNYSFSGTTIAATFPQNVTAGNLIAFMVSWASPTVTLTTVTDNCNTAGSSNTYTLVSNPTNGANSVRAALGYVAVGATTPSCTVTATFSGNPSDRGIDVSEISGINSSSILDQAALNPMGFTASGTNAATSGSITTTTNGDYIFGGSANFNSTSMTAGTNFTIGDSVPNKIYTEHQIQSAAGTIAANFTTAGNGYNITGIMAFKPAASPPASPASVQKANNYSFSGTTIAATFPQNVTAGNLIAFMVSWASSTVTLNTVTDSCNTGGSSNAYTLVSNPTNGANSVRAALGYVVVGATTPSCTVTATFSGNPSDRGIDVSEISGINSSSILDQAALNPMGFTASGTDAATSGNITTTTNGDYIFGGSANFNSTSMNPGTNFTLSDSVPNKIYTEQQIQSAAGTIAANFTTAGGGYNITGIMAFKPAGGPPPPSGIIDPSRRIDWSQAGVPGGIVDRPTICQTLSPGVTVEQINAAIQACPAGQSVFLNAGIYTLASGISFAGKSNVTLRGAGPDVTILKIGSAASCGGATDADICISNGDFSFYPSSPFRNTAGWTGGYSKGTTAITLSNTTGLQVGQLMVLDQLNDSNTDNSSLWVCSAVANPALNFAGCSGEGGITAFSTDGNREQMQTVRVTALNGNNVTISPGLYMPNWRSGQSPAAFWGAALPIIGAGIEAVTIENTYTGSDPTVKQPQAGIAFFGSYGSWARNIRSIKSNRGHIWMFVSKNNAVRDSYFYGTVNAASQSYGVETDLAADNLFENNIFEQVAGALTQGTGTTGNVFGYNYELHDGFTNPAAWMQPESIMHASATNMLLFEGNTGEGFAGDDFHGPSFFITSFRERNIGWDTGRTENTFAVQINALNRYWNVVGDVLGQAGYHTAYLAGPASSIYSLGGPYGTNVLPFDTLTVTSLMRWGNYDTFNNAVKFDVTEIPSALNLFANPVPANHALPASLYLSGKPNWWPTLRPWPGIGPDVSGGDVSGVAGFAYKSPSQLCYESANGDLAYNSIIKLFNANNCYASR